MRVTNFHNIPEEFIRFNDLTAHDKGESDISVSTLIDSPQIGRLAEANDERMEYDVAEDILRILGTAVHTVLEQGAEGLDGVVMERRFFVPVGDHVLSGQCDRLEQKENGKWKLSDYKVTTGASVVFNPKGKDSWIKQVNVYRWLALQSGFDVDEVEIIVVVRDWSAANARRDHRFPQAAVVRIPVWLWDKDQATEYVEERMKIHFSDEEHGCSDEERWLKPTQYAVHEYLKSGTGLRKRATRVFEDIMDADRYIKDNRISAEVIERQGSPTRCEQNWCGVAEFCPQYRRERE